MKFKSILSLVVFICSAFMLSQNILAEDGEAKKPAKEKKASVPLEDLSHTGVVEEKKNKKRNTFYLKTAVGKIRLPVSPKGSKNPIKLVSYVGKKVTVTGKGFVKVRKTKKGESKKVYYKKILEVKDAASEGEEKVEEKK